MCGPKSQDTGPQIPLLKMEDYCELVENYKKKKKQI